MIYKSCKYIQHGIAFRHDAVSICNKLCGTKRYEKFNINYEGDFYKKYIDVRNEAIENCKKGILPHDGCNYCPYVEEKDWDDECKFKEIEITHWVHCNCGCCYCAMLPVTKGKMVKFKQNSPYVKLLPVIKRMLKDGMIADDAFFSVTGGELTVLKEFPDIMKLLLKQKNASYGFCLQTNGIKYEKLLSEALERDRRTSIVISIDAGTREMFKKMKRVDKFNDVINNIKHYLRNTKTNKDRVVAKYIIVPNVNDSKEEIDKWITLCKDIGIKTMQPSIEFCSQVVSPGIFRQKQGELYKYMKSQIIENGFEIITYDFLEEIIKNESFDITIKRDKSAV